MRRLIVSAVLFFLLTACTIGPDYVKPVVETPSVFTYSDGGTREAVNMVWWQQFQDPVLDTSNQRGSGQQQKYQDRSSQYGTGSRRDHADKVASVSAVRIQWQRRAGNAYPDWNPPLWITSWKIPRIRIKPLSARVGKLTSGDVSGD